MNRLILDNKNGYHIFCYDQSFPEQRAMVICLHGLAGDKDSSVINRLTHHLKDIGIGTFVFDWPAHGESDVPHGELTVEHCIMDLQTVINHVSQKYKVPLYCFATSYGGYLAMVYHLSHPETFRHIILRSPALNMAEVFLGLRPLEITEALKRGETLDFGFEQPLMLNMSFYDDLKVHDIFQISPQYPDRILVIHGDQDVDVPTSDSLDYCNRNHIRIHIIKGCDHRYKNPGELEEVLAVAASEYTDR